MPNNNDKNMEDVEAFVFEHHPIASRRSFLSSTTDFSVLLASAPLPASAKKEIMPADQAFAAVRRELEDPDSRVARMQACIDHEQWTDLLDITKT